MSDEYATIKRRLANYKELLAEADLTPLHRQQLESAVSLCHKALYAPKLGPYLKDLDAQQERLNEHWVKFYGEWYMATLGRTNMRVVQGFLEDKLREDYLSRPHKAHWRILELAEHVTKRDDKQYDDYVSWPCRELFLNEQHVARKFYHVFERKGQPGNDVQPFIEGCDWTALASALVYDREIADRLLDTSAISKDVHGNILQSINRIQRKHYTELNSPEVFVVSAHARKLSDKRAHGSRTFIPAWFRKERETSPMIDL